MAQHSGQKLQSKQTELCAFRDGGCGIAGAGDQPEKQAVQKAEVLCAGNDDSEPEFEALEAGSFPF